MKIKLNAMKIIATIKNIPSKEKNKTETKQMNKQNQVLGPDRFIGNFKETFKVQILPLLFYLVYSTEKDGKLPDQFL